MLLRGMAVSYERGTPCRLIRARDAPLAASPVRPPRSESASSATAAWSAAPGGERVLFIDNLLVRIHFIVVMIRWTGLAPWEFEFPFPGSLTSTFLV